MSQAPAAATNIPGLKRVSRAPVGLLFLVENTVE